MSYNYTLKYRTFESLLNDIQVDFQNYSLQNMIEPQQLIKIAKKINYDLGLRIYMTKEALLEVENGKVKLPDDFFVLNFAMICDDFTVVQSMPRGTNIQEVPLRDPMLTPYKETSTVINTCTDGPVNCQKCPPNQCTCSSSCVPSCDLQPESNCVPQYNPLVPYGNSCVKPRVFMNCKGDCYELIQVTETRTSSYRRLLPLKILENPQTIDCGCPNLYLDTPNQAWIQNGFLYTTFKEGKVYINYQGMLEDENGDLLVPDHDMINEYYEYAVKQRILENLLMNDENVTAKLQLVEARLRQARNYALSIVNTPNFAEMKRMWWTNRRAQYAKYYDMFKSYPWYQWDRNPNNVMGEGVGSMEGIVGTRSGLYNY